MLRLVLIGVVFVGVWLVLGGCRPPAPPVTYGGQDDKKAPPFELRLVEVNSLGEFSGIRAEGVEEYIARFGKAGWIAGLSDSRPIFPEAHKQREELFLRIREIFYSHYCRVFPKPGREGVKALATLKERDALVEEVLAEVKALPDR